MFYTIYDAIVFKAEKNGIKEESSDKNQYTSFLCCECLKILSIFVWAISSQDSI